jgi:hypothetical protein
MTVMEVLLYIVGYIFISGVVGAVLYKDGCRKENNPTQKQRDEFVGPAIFLGLIWPIVLPAWAGVALVHAVWKEKK